MSIYETQIFRSSLLDDPKIYRDIEIASSLSLYRLAKAIVAAYDFDFDHCFGFYPNTNRAKVLRATPAYELFADIGEETDALSVKRTAVATAFRQPNHTMLFLFDYGDGWLFRIESLRSGSSRTRSAKVLGRSGAAPEQYPSEEEFADE